MLITIVAILLFVVIALLSIFRSLLYGVLNVIASFFESIFHSGRSGSGTSGGNNTGKTRIHTKPARKEKIFTESDGEYVDYEEVRK